ncbi:MAG TPA: sugar ABC transporter permease [Actinomycetota bacterium]|jgi:trehalose transport system permease protein|nr:sugar ABC transporter permease [Actinomycetota bacterium]
MAVAEQAGRYRPSRAGLLAAWVRRHRFEIALITPLVAYVVLLTIAPIIDTFKISLTHPRTLAFPSGANYQANFGSATFREATVNTVIVAVLSLTLELAVGLAVALALHARFRGQGFVRTVMLVPLGVPTIVSGAIMLLIFARSGYMNSVFGGVANLISNIPGVDWEFRNLSWTTDGGIRTLATVAIADMWKVLPIVTLIFLAGLQSIPEDIYEAADVDGATKWQKFARITFPLLIPYITMALILRSIDAFRIFELALVLAGAIEPVLGTYIWDRYGPPTNDVFTASSASIVLFGIIMVFIILYLRFVATRAEVAR